MGGLDATTMTVMIASVSAAIAACGVAVSIGMSNRSKNRDEIAAQTTSIELAANFSALMSGVNKIEGCVNEINRKMDNHTERIIILETNARILKEQLEETDGRLSILVDRHNNRKDNCPSMKGRQ